MENAREECSDYEERNAKFETLKNGRLIALERRQMKCVLGKTVQTINPKTQSKIAEIRPRSPFAFVVGRNDSMITWERTQRNSVV